MGRRSFHHLSLSSDVIIIDGVNSYVDARLYEAFCAETALHDTASICEQITSSPSRDGA